MMKARLTVQIYRIIRDRGLTHRPSRRWAFLWMGLLQTATLVLFDPATNPASPLLRTNC